MRRFGLVATIVSALLIGAQLPARAQDPLLSVFRDYLESLRVQAGIPGLSAAIVGRNDIIWEHGFGRQDLERALPARPDTPYHLDGLTQLFTAALTLRCVEEGRLTLDDRVARFDASSPIAAATLRDILSHSLAANEGAGFLYRPERLEAAGRAISICTRDSYRETLALLLERLAMHDSVPGTDAVTLEPPAPGIPTPSQAERYSRTLQRLAVSYAVDGPRRNPIPSVHPVTTLTPFAGLVSTVRDVAQFDLALKKGVLLRADTLEAAWQPQTGRDGQLQPSGLGWFVSTYKGERVVWQFGLTDGASSSLVMTVPARGVTLILLGNSSGLVRPFTLSSGDLMVSPFARMFLGLFVR